MLAAKKSWQEAEPARRVEARQAWVNALTEFARRHPDHPRAIAAYAEVELEYATLLADRGRYDEALRYFRSVLESDPSNEVARQGLAEAERKRFVTREALESLRKGDRQERVREVLGQPLPGWSRRLVRGSSVIDSWYYRRRDGGVAGVFFHDGRLFAAEFDAPLPLDS